MSSWLLSVAGIVVVGALVEILLTDSSIHKFVKSIYAFFVLFVIAQPLPGFFKDTVFSLQTGGAIELNTELMEKINLQTADAFQRNAMTALSTAGFDGIIVTIDTDKQTNFKINSIYVNALGVVLRTPDANIDIEQEVIRIVCAVCNISKEAVQYVG